VAVSESQLASRLLSHFFAMWNDVLIDPKSYHKNDNNLRIFI